MAEDVKFVLSIHGGGVRDLIPATVLDLVQTRTGRHTLSLFDMIVGVSGGAMMALNTAVDGLRPNRGPMLNYTEMFSPDNLNLMLDKSLIDRVMGEVQFEPVYDGTGKTTILKRYLGEHTTMGDLSKSVRVAVPIYNISHHAPEIFTTYDPSQASSLAWQVGDASSAAVPYFPAVQMGGCNYVDGGFAANNPVLVAYTEARRAFGDSASIRMMALGSGQNTVDVWKADVVRGWGSIQWLMNGLVDLVLEAPNDIQLQQTMRLMELEGSGNRLLWIDQEIPVVKLDDTTPHAREILVNAGKQAYQHYEEDIVKFFDTSRPFAPSQRIKFAGYDDKRVSPQPAL